MNLLPLLPQIDYRQVVEFGLRQLVEMMALLVEQEKPGSE
jgi:hypothetical protein